MLVAKDSRFDHNKATGGYNGNLAGVAGGLAAGGAIHHLGDFSFDKTTVIEKNNASTSGDNLAP